ncbi:aftiphilin-like [Xiphias gladius]|uniref:aftiphilin-like n=1 Tax=Xiphias gladius TaxID=8245 RepID=UPI001A982081|nr:aftiphilin-like [Xiphias gladius]XP_039995093.1 aftiphilin-like [Xiphias gladius]XP_039995094.1 aftiphilin-like [Xiphias gladius]
MEPIITPLHSSSAPPLGDDGDGEAGSEEDEFGDFGGFSVGVSCSPLGFADSSKPPSGLRQPSPTTKPATNQPDCSFNHPAEKSQPTSIVNSGSGGGQIDVEGQDCNAESSLHLTNGYAEGDRNYWAQNASVAGTCSPKEETGFADFTVFTEQAAHPWCCGFSPLGSTEQWAGRVEGTDLRDQIRDPGHEVIMDSVPRFHCAYEAKENVCTKVKHCEKRDAALMQPSQDHHQPQEATAALGFPSEKPHLGEEDVGKRGDSWRERRRSLNPSQTSEVQEDGECEKDGGKSISTVPQTFSVYDSASEDPASVCDDLSLEGASADSEPNVSSLSSQGDQTDGDQTDDEDEELGSYRHSDPFVIGSMANLSRSEAEKGVGHCNQSATQETSATSDQSHSVTYTPDEFADSTDSSFEHHDDQDRVQTPDVRVRILGSLPPSDSFADFCSAPTQEDGDGWWAEFQDQRAQEEGKTSTQLLQGDGDTEGERDRVGQYGVLRRNSCQESLSCRVQQLICASFPEVAVPAVDCEEVALSLGALLHTQHFPESGEEKMPELGGAQWVQRGLWWPHQDVTSAVGLQFQWAVSHTKRTLLRCLGVDTRNTGMLEPIKESVPAVCPPGYTAVTAQAPPGPQDIPDPSMQEALPSSQLDWSSRGLSSSQDGTSPRRAPHFWGRK